MRLEELRWLDGAAWDVSTDDLVKRGWGWDTAMGKCCVGVKLSENIYLPLLPASTCGPRTVYSPAIRIDVSMLILVEDPGAVIDEPGLSLCNSGAHGHSTAGIPGRPLS